MFRTFSKITSIFFPPTACGPPPVIQNGHVTNTERNILHGDYVDYECNAGYFADGSNSDKLRTMCESSGSYTLNSADLATCSKC